MRDAQGNPVKDNKGNPIYDYFVVVTTNDKNQELIGAPYDQTTNRIRSLVSGNEYGRANTTPVETGHRPADNLKIYQQAFGTLSQPVLTAITAAQTFYQQRSQQAEGNQQLPDGGSGQQTSTGDMSGKTGYSGTAQQQPSGIHPTPGGQSINERTQEASGGDWSFGG